MLMTEDAIDRFKGTITLVDGNVQIEDVEKFRSEVLDNLLADAVLHKDKKIRALARYVIKSVALEVGAFPSSIQGLYEAMGHGVANGFTVPAINIRGLTYELARAIFRSAQKIDCGAMIFEIAKSEIGYTFQRPHEYSAVILAAAIKEKHHGPVFIQGDHFQINAKKYLADPEREVSGIKSLISEGISAGFYNIDIDTSTLVDLSHSNIIEQQRPNFEVGVELTRYVREKEPEGVTVSVGGEIGEVGKENSTPDELKTYMDNFNEDLSKFGKNLKGISKISVQTGTSHGGVPMPDGTIAKVNLDFQTLAILSKIAREEYGLSGAVQHGASTLPALLFHRFPELATAEIHLATDFQNMIYESDAFPNDFKEEIYAHLRVRFADENKPGQTDEQFIYKTRKKGFGEFKSKFWALPRDVKTAIGNQLSKRFDFLFDKLNVNNTREIINRTVIPTKIKPNLKTETEWA